jgi:hypothetical protein
LRFKPCKGKPNTHAWNTTGSFRSNRLPFIPTRGSDPPQAIAGHTHFQSVGRTSVAQLQNPYSWLPSNTYAYTSNKVTKRSKNMWWEVCPLPGRLVTRFTAYHISRHVVSTFKRLTTATTHCDLIKFHNTDGVSS